MQIEDYRTRLEEFEQNLNRELYRYRSGLKGKLEIASIYSDYSDLFSIDSIREAEAELKKTGESFGSRRRSFERIISYLLDQYIDSGLASLNQELAASESKATISWQGRSIAVSQTTAYLRKEPDALSRRNLADRYSRALAETEELKRELFGRLQALVSRLGFRNYVEARERIDGICYRDLLSSYSELLARTEDRFNQQFRQSLEIALGVPFEQTGSWDLPFWENQHDPLHVFPGRSLVPFVETVISEMGIRPENPEAVVFDLEPRERKHPRPCCIPVRIPHEIRIVMLPEDGSRHYAALLHETGHACHFAWTSSSLPFENRVWGDRALSEAYAFLLEYLVYDPDLLRRLLSFEKSRGFIQFHVLNRILLIRKCMGRLSFALKLHERGSCDDAPQLYAETMKDYTGLSHPPELWLSESLDAFDSAFYLRGSALEAVLREYLRTKYGSAWMKSRSASGFFKEIWETGYLYRAEELCREIGYDTPGPDTLAGRLSEELQS